jgi:preprotein translocase subunit SecA
MIGKVIKGFQGIFGNKSDRDLKELEPYVEKINQEFKKLSSLSHDELRNKTTEFRSRIDAHLESIDSEIKRLKEEIKTLAKSDLERTEELYTEIDKLEEQRNEELEVVLEEILPEAFAVVKETARRFTEEDMLEVQATEMDRDLAASREHILIDGDKAKYKTSWEAAGAEVSWNMVHYDVQLIGGVVLHQGKIAEMATGEGKTLVSTLPAYLNALGKRGVHIVTVNDYLARRDSEWNAPIFQFHGLSVDCIDYYRPHSPERKQAYLADITFGTNNEFGFDYLRDNMVHAPEELVQRKHHFAMIDEVDSVLIDDARTPLIISGPTPKGDEHEFHELKPRIQKLVDAQKRGLQQALTEGKKLLAEGKEKEGALLLFRAYRGYPKSKPLIKFLNEPGMKALLQKTENFYLQDSQREMHVVDEELYFTIDEKNNQVELTDKGIELITKSGEDKEFFIIPDVGGMMADIENDTQLEAQEKLAKKDEIMRDFSIKSERIHSINQLLKAYTLFEKDVEYIVQDNKVKIVDEQTGRVMDGRRYSDGLHQAIEAKENVKVEAATQTFATVTLQNFFRMYHKLAGMTGTAETEAGEFWEIYELDVVVIPTNKPIIRDDREDLVYKTKREKYNAVIDEVLRLQAEGRPVLVGTTSVDVSETLSRMLHLRKIKHNVLNAKQHQREADIVAEAGHKGAVTIATNMAGRGTDIKLSKEVLDSGGLAIVGTERHESRRVDRQLRGRAGRQGDPGSSQFFVSLEDDLMRLFGSERVAGVMDRFGHEEGEVIQHSLITKTIERSQKKVEQNNFGIRKRLLEYDDVMNKQREVIYSRRRHALHGDKLAVDIRNAVYNWCDNAVNYYKESEDFEGFKFECLRDLACEPKISEENFLGSGNAVDLVYDDIMNQYFNKGEFIKSQAVPVLQNIRRDRGEDVKNIVIPFTDGKSGIRCVVDLNEAIQSQGDDIITSLEKSVALSSIDQHWKEHLRELDDLRQATGTAHLEQKDPLLIYKLESFNLFQKMVGELDKDVLGLLFKSYIENQDPKQVQEAKARVSDNSRMQTSRANTLAGPQSAPAQERKPVNVPVRKEKKIGRNDPCPCGSGKKYKKCHGRDA